MPIEDNSTRRINIAHTSPFADETHSEIDVVNNSNHLQSSDFEGILSAWTQYQQVSMSIPFLSNILFMANDGSSSDQASVFQAILDKEPIIMAHLQTRKTSIMGVDWDIMGDNSYKCSEIKRIMEDAGYHDLIPHLLDCIGNGYAEVSSIEDLEKYFAKYEEGYKLEPLVICILPNLSKSGSLGSCLQAIKNTFEPLVRLKQLSCPLNVA